MNWFYEFQVNAFEMRLFNFLCSRKPQNPFRVPLQAPRLPLKLRDKVRDSKAGSHTTTDTQEIINLLNALAKNDFNEKHCQKEIADLKRVQQTCFDEYKAKAAERKAEEIKVGTDLNSYQINKVLKKFSGK